MAHIPEQFTDTLTWIGPCRGKLATVGLRVGRPHGIAVPYGVLVYSLFALHIVSLTFYRSEIALSWWGAISHSRPAISHNMIMAWQSPIQGRDSCYGRNDQGIRVWMRALYLGFLSVMGSWFNSISSRAIAFFPLTLLLV